MFVFYSIHLFCSFFFFFFLFFYILTETRRVYSFKGCIYFVGPPCYKYLMDDTLLQLNENHKIAIFSTLCLLEKDIDEIEMLIESPLHGRLYEIYNDLTDIQKEEILFRIKSLRRYIYEYADNLKLESVKESLNGIIRGTFSLRWVDVCELESKPLRGYGIINQDVNGILNYFAKNMEKLLSNI